MIAAYLVVGTFTVLLLVALYLLYRARRNARRDPATPVLPELDEEYLKYYDALRDVVCRLCRRTEDPRYGWTTETGNSYYLDKGFGYTNLAVIRPPYSPNPADGVNNLVVEVKIYQIFADSQAPLYCIAYRQGLSHEVDLLVFEPKWPVIDLTTRAAQSIPGLACASTGQLKALVDRLKHDEPLPTT